MAPKEVIELVRRFEDNEEDYTSSAYNETRLRREFVDPFFKALGWDVDNSGGFAEAYKDVIHEDTIKVGSATKAPDYCFRIGGTRKFFLETKRPTLHLKDDIPSAFQLRRYGWSAKLPLSILTDFKELAVYDCRVKPGSTDKAATARIAYFTLKDYEKKWGEIAGIFSKEAVLKGSFDKFAEKKGKRGTEAVDEAFLEQIDTWRRELAQNLALRNSDITQKQINSAVQVTLDRLVFLRICEARGIEDYGKLLLHANGSNVYARLSETFRMADARYNSGLFHFESERGRTTDADLSSLTYKIDDKPLQEVITGLYPPKSPYEFSVLPADILGSVYERFLGKVIRLTDGHRAKVEERPEVIKAGGVFYTPTYIVNYIVESTLGKLLLNNTPEKVARLRILDPACGSGSFLIGAYQKLLDWHLSWYSEDGTKKWSIGKEAPLRQGTNGEWRLSLSERRKILVNNIFGVDIDPQAVEVTKLSLLLKVLEGETGDTLPNQPRLIHDRALPDIGGNIKCGNSLVGPDYALEEQIDLLGTDEDDKINAFDWKDSFSRGGTFDVVIGNPPYLGGREWKEEGGRRYDYFVRKYEVAAYQFDIYALFFEKAVKLLNGSGVMGFITPNTWLNNQSNLKLRSFLLGATQIESIADYTKVKVFPNATVLPVVTILGKGRSSDSACSIYEPGTDGTLVLLRRIDQGIWERDELKVINIALDEKASLLRTKLEASGVKLEDVAEVKFGIKIYETGKGIPAQKAEDAKNKKFEGEKKLDSTWRKYLEGKDVNRFGVDWNSRWLKYGGWLAAPRDKELFEGERVLVRRIVGRKLIAAFVDDDYVTSQLLQIVKPKGTYSAKLLTAILNSSLMGYYFRKKYNRTEKVFPEIRIYELASLPLPRVSKESSKELADIADLVGKLAILLSGAGLRGEPVEKKLKPLERRLDALVYSLYGLTEMEVEAIEAEMNAQT